MTVADLLISLPSAMLSLQSSVIYRMIVLQPHTTVPCDVVEAASEGLLAENDPSYRVVQSSSGHGQQVIEDELADTFILILFT